MCQFPRHAFRDAVEQGQKPSAFLRERLSSAAKVFFSIGVAYWGPAIALGVVLFLRVNQLNTWTQGSCFVVGHGDIVCVGRNDTECSNRVLRTSFWRVDFCPTIAGCSLGPTELKISFNESTFENARSTLSRHPVRSTDDCYMNPNDLTQVVWKDSITGLFSWVIPVFVFFSMFTVLLMSPCFYMIYVAFKIRHYYQRHPDARANAGRRLEPLSPNLRRQPPRVRPDMDDDAPENSIPDIYKLDMEASIDMNASKACNVCFAHRINCRLLPCKHKFTCMECGKFFLGKPCGLCRVDVVKLRRVVRRKRNPDDQRAPDGPDQQSDVIPDTVKTTPKKKRQRKRRQNEAPPHASADTTSGD